MTTGLMLAEEFKRRYNTDLIIPDLNVPTYSTMTMSASLALLDKLYDEVSIDDKQLNEE
jgi:hypothetical protein